MPADTSPSAARPPLGERLGQIGLLLALVCAVAAVFSGLGYRLGLWHFRTGFMVLRVAFFLALGAGVISLLSLIFTRPLRAGAALAALIGLAIAAVTVYIPLQWKRTLDSLPYIHDITTDLDNPPRFVAAANLRKPGEHPVEYDGPEVAEQQRKGYPDLAPFMTQAPPDKVFDAAKAAIAVMRLELTEANQAEGRLEAVDTSLLYGFKDDIVVRIQPTTDGTRVDVRSKSRVGRSDLGQNAKRIRTFLQELKAGVG